MPSKPQAYDPRQHATWRRVAFLAKPQFVDQAIPRLEAAGIAVAVEALAPHPRLGVLYDLLVPKAQYGEADQSLTAFRRELNHA